MNVNGSTSKNPQMPRLHWYEPNIRAILATYITGVGPQDMAEILSSLDLPQTRFWNTKGYARLSNRLSKHMRNCTKESTRQAMVGEIEATIREKLQNINEVDIKKEVTDYFNLPINLRPSIGISISYDMGWQKRTIHRQSSSYSSLSGHGFEVGLRTKKIASMIVFAKHCQTCKIVKKN